MRVENRPGRLQPHARLTGLDVEADGTHRRRGGLGLLSTLVSGRSRHLGHGREHNEQQVTEI